MTQVSSRAIGKLDVHAAPGSMAVSLPRTRWLVTAMLAAAVVALVLATRAPLTVTVLGLIAFGVLHNVLEIRYVAGRFATVLTGRFLLLLLLLCSGIAACRVLAPAWPQGSRYAEVVIGYLILLAGCALGLRGLRLVAGTVTLAVAAYASLSYPAYHFVVLTHLHNLVPWSSCGTGRAPARAPGRLPGHPGAVDSWSRCHAGRRGRPLDPRLPASSPASSATARRSGQAPPAAARWAAVPGDVRLHADMHYVVWVGFLPRFAPDAAAAFDARVPWLRGRRAWVVGIVAGGSWPCSSSATTSRAGRSTARWPPTTPTWSSRSCWLSCCPRSPCRGPSASGPTSASVVSADRSWVATE